LKSKLTWDAADVMVGSLDDVVKKGAARGDPFGCDG
jgi:hypothetical protein